MSRKQSIAADSTGASEMIAVHAGMRECLMIHDLLKPNGEPLRVRVDNSTVVRISKRGSSSNLDYLEKRPIALKLGLLKDMQDYGVITLDHVESSKNRADIFTKVFERVKFVEVRDLLGMSSR